MKRFDEVKMNGKEMTEQELDQQLNSGSHQQLRQALKVMPEETVSMAWRSQLNEKLVANMAARQRKKRVAWFLSPALGLGLAGALAVMVFTNTPNVPQPSPSQSSGIEANLVASFNENMNYSDVTGVGLNPQEVVNGKSSHSYDPVEVDFGSL